MRYSSALVLSTLAAGQAAAANIRHASFHARRHAEKRGDYDAVDWKKVSYDLSNVDWSSVFATPTPTPAPAAEEPKVEVKSEYTPEPTSAPAPAPQSSKVEEEKPKETAKEEEEDSSSNPIGDFVEDLMDGVEDVVKKLGIISTGQNDKSDNGGIWIGESDWMAEFINDGDSDCVLFCWKADGFDGMSLNVNKPEISVGLKPGQKVNVGWAPNVPSACAPVFGDTKLAIFGAPSNTWAEMTFGQYGAFDVSRNVNMKGNNISMKGSKCTSDMSTCYFGCTNGQDSCEKGTDYDLMACGEGTGGGGGYDPIMQGTGGGCAMGAEGEKITITLS